MYFCFQLLVLVHCSYNGFHPCTNFEDIEKKKRYPNDLNSLARSSSIRNYDK